MDFSNDRPIYIQLLDRLQFLIVSGNIKLGERIPSVRDLAFEYKINPNTVQKALQELENIGLIYTERTNGKFVTDDKKLIEKYKGSLAKEHTKNYFENMEKLGFCFPSEVITNSRYGIIENNTWATGFWPGTLWLGYELTGDKRYKERVEALLRSFHLRIENKLFV